ncbi:MAG: PDZ domain-containing protein [Gemmatimonadetes bacterium]|nr:PDZ domain-containing protein [Gemmatimonadota bacterium]
MGREAAPYAELLRQGGFMLRRSRARRPGSATSGFAMTQGKATVTGVTPIGSPLYAAGVDRHDRLVSLDGHALASAEDWTVVLDAHKPGDVVPLVFESRGETLNVMVTMGESPRIEIVPFEAAGETVSDAVRAFRASWLGRQ